MMQTIQFRRFGSQPRTEMMTVERESPSDAFNAMYAQWDSFPGSRRARLKPRLGRSESLKWPRRLRCGRFYVALAVVHGARKGEVVQGTFSRRAFLTGLGMLSIPLIALAQDREKKKSDDKSKEENKKEAEKKAEEKKDEAKSKAEDAVDDRDKAVDAPGTDRSQDRRQDRRRDAVK